MSFVGKRRPPPLQAGAKAWTPEEDEVLRAWYEKEGAAEMARRLGRPLTSIHHRTQRLKLYTHRAWTKVDDNNLAMLWGEMSVGWIARRLKRTSVATYYRARYLGLRCGAPRGMEYVRNAADRAGFALDTLLLILGWAGMQVRPSMSRPSGSRRRLHIVDPQDVDDAVALWMAAESVETAAVARGMDGATLARWLEDSGLTRPPRRKRWRVATETINAVVAARRGRESVSAAARRLGTNRDRLRELLVASGKSPPTACRTWWIEPAWADEAGAVGLPGREGE